MERIKQWAKTMKHQLLLLYCAYQDYRVPLYAKLFSALVLAYAFSPIDLIPDFIPILGYLDDIILVPIGIYLSLKMIPKEVLQDASERADKMVAREKPKNWFMGVVIVGLWFVLTCFISLQLYEMLF